MESFEVTSEQYGPTDACASRNRSPLPVAFLPIVPFSLCVCVSSKRAAPVEGVFAISGTAECHRWARWLAKWNRLDRFAGKLSHRGTPLVQKASHRSPEYAGRLLRARSELRLVWPVSSDHTESVCTAQHNTVDNAGRIHSGQTSCNTQMNDYRPPIAVIQSYARYFLFFVIRHMYVRAFVIIHNNGRL